MQKLFPIADDFYNILKDTQRGKIALNKTLVGYGKYKRVAIYIRLYNIFGESKKNRCISYQSRS
jgi:hypothetical protein